MSPFNQGKQAFLSGGYPPNPFKESTPQYRSWEFGFNKAYFENLEKVKREEDGQDT